MDGDRGRDVRKERAVRAAEMSAAAQREREPLTPEPPLGSAQHHWSRLVFANSHPSLSKHN